MYVKILKATTSWLLLGIVNLLGESTGRKIRFALLAAGAAFYAVPFGMASIILGLSLLAGNTTFAMFAGALLAFYVAGGLWAFPQLNRFGIELQEMGGKRLEAKLRRTLRESFN